MELVTKVEAGQLQTPVKETKQRVTTHDRAVLMTLFEHCRGGNWTCSSNWGSDEELSRWYNVSVSLTVYQYFLQGFG